MRVIYLDHNSTTPMLDEVSRAMAEYNAAGFGNPSSQHQLGRRARQALDVARDGIGRILGAQMSGHQADRVVLTSGGTEANNLLVFGLARVHEPDAAPGEAIISAMEHHSIAVAAEVLERRGWRVHRLPLTGDGVVDLAPLDAWLSPTTRFVSVMLANNETGVIQPIAQIAARASALGVPMHTDASQIVGKLPVDFRALGVSAMTVAAHKFHGPLGVGALVLRHDLELASLMFGGFQQSGSRPGTESAALAIGLHAALAAWEREARRDAWLRSLRDRLESGLAAGYEGQVVVNGAAAERLPNTSNVALVGLDRQALLMALDLAGVACSTGSACASGSSEPSHVLKAMGCPQPVLAASLRFSIGATTTSDEIEDAIERISDVANKISGTRPSERTSVR